MNHFKNQALLWLSGLAVASIFAFGIPAGASAATIMICVNKAGCLQRSKTDPLYRSKIEPPWVHGFFCHLI
jgi:hypothetical protein